MYIGYAAAFLTTVAYLPQALKTIRTRNTDGLSLIMYLCMVAGVFCWLIYGIALGDVALIAANALTFAFALPILVIAFANQWRKGKPD